MINDWDHLEDVFEKSTLIFEIEDLKASLELDGFTFLESRLLVPERDVLDIQEEIGVLESLYLSLGLNNKDIAFHHLALSEEHYLNMKWDDSISNSRKFFESVLRETASTFNWKVKEESLPESIYKKPIEIRKYLEQIGLINSKENGALASIYGLLSETGGHPHMAIKDQARLLRQLALTLSQFVMLRLQGRLSE